MKVYLDYIFFENVIVNYFISIQIPIFCKIPKKRIRIIISSIIVAIYTTIIQAVGGSFIENSLIKLLIIFSATYIAYKPLTIIKYFKYFLCYLMFYFIYIGINIFIILFFNVAINNLLIKILVYILSYILLTIINRIMWKMWKNNIKNQIVYKINVNNFEFNAFVDTGNNVKDINNNLDVIFVSDELKGKILNNYSADITDIEINTATSKEKFTGYIFENAKISTSSVKVELKKVVIVFIEKNLFIGKKYSGLISYDTYIEKLEGATL